MSNITKEKETLIKAKVLDHLVQHLRDRNEVQNIDLMNLAKRVEKQSNIYKQQLTECKNSLSTSKYIIF